MNSENVKEYFGKIKEKNQKFYEVISAKLQKDSSLGICEDVLKYIANHIEEYDKEMEYLYNIADLATNIKISPECIGWINEYFGENKKINISDFGIVFNEAIEKDIPLEEIKSFFSTDSMDILEIYQKIEEYEEPVSKEEEEKVSSVEMSSEKALLIEPETVKIEPQRRETGYEEVVANLMTVMAHRNCDEEPILLAQENVSKILAKFQSSFNEMSICTTEIIRDWEKEKENCERLQALLEIQQKMMNSQQYTINKLRNENAQLNERIQEAARAEMQIRDIKKQLAKFQSLSE